MLKRFLPRQDKFFDYFNYIAGLMAEAAAGLVRLLQQSDQSAAHLENIAHIREAARQHARLTFDLLHKTFITPFDRYDINSLLGGLDDIIAMINRCARHFPVYALQSVPPELVELAVTAHEATELLKKAVCRLHSMKLSEEIFRSCEEIDAMELRAHQAVMKGEIKLFREENDFRQFFRLKEMYGEIKLMVNRCQSTANLIRGIVLEYT